MKPNTLPPSLVANLQNVLIGRKGGGGGGDGDEPAEETQVSSSSSSTTTTEMGEKPEEWKPIVLVTNGDGIGAPGLVCLVEALVGVGRYDVHVCAPESDKSVSGHSVTIQETLVASSADINGSTAFEVSGTPVDCVSLALSGSLFSWLRPTLVISGINKGSNCGQNNHYSSTIAGAREALLCGVPSLSISLNWKKDGSQESDFKDAVDVCLPLINAAVRDIGKGIFPKDCFLNICIPTCPKTNKGFKLTKQSLWRCQLSWQAVSGNRYPSAGQFMSKHQSLGIQLAQLSRDASAAGAARRISAQRKTMEVESVAAAGKSEIQKGNVKKYFRLEFLDKEQEEADEELDCKAIDIGFVSVTPISLSFHTELEVYSKASDWITSALTVCEEAS